ncbi:hypothetical protein HOLleu_03828 [Holothuria leucospilota]|uniref:Reverse transcriptase domain-containing protein n=1 Tax=Holothuria leucospilota TaxID=206669 RepID=A0A9Q1CT29_HOLLE|nr:hypothetical protein HOLleu_03828 [Holothuria leucospilota]
MLGKQKLLVLHGDKYHLVEFQIVETDLVPALGLSTCLTLQLIRRLFSVDAEGSSATTVTREEIIASYPEVFNGLETLEDEYTIRRDENAQPIVQPPKRIAHALVSEPPSWINGMVILEKTNSDVRICIDPKQLNKAIKGEHHPFKSVDDVASKLSDANLLTVLDADQAFWQVEFTESSRHYVTFNTPY